MRITENKLRELVRSVIKENIDSFDFEHQDRRVELHDIRTDHSDTIDYQLVYKDGGVNTAEEFSDDIETAIARIGENIYNIDHVFITDASDEDLNQLMSYCRDKGLDCMNMHRGL